MRTSQAVRTRAFELVNRSVELPMPTLRGTFDATREDGESLRLAEVNSVLGTLQIIYADDPNRLDRTLCALEQILKERRFARNWTAQSDLLGFVLRRARALDVLESFSQPAQASR